MTSKIFVEEQQVIEDSFELGVKIFNSGFRPTFIVGLWRGGSTVGIYLQECLQTLNITTNHIALRTSYNGRRDYEAALKTPNKPISVHGTQYLLDTLNREDRLLLVDDVFGSGRTLAAVLEKLTMRLKRNLPQEIKTACLFQRQSSSASVAPPDYVGKTISSWVTLSYELQDLSLAELKTHKPAFLTITEQNALALPSSFYYESS